MAYKMAPEDLQALRDQADVVGLHDIEVGKFLKLLIPHVAALSGLDLAEEDARRREESDRQAEQLHKAQLEASQGAQLTPAQEESKAQAEAQGRDYDLAAADPALDPLARDAQEQGTIVVPTAQVEEQVPEKPGLDPSVSTYPDFSSSDTHQSSSTYGKKE